MKNSESSDNSPRKSPPKLSRFWRVLLHVMLAIVVLAAGTGIFFLLMKLRKPPEKQDLEVVHPLVKVRTIKTTDVRMTVRGFGTVQPKVEVDIVPEVSGKVVHVHPELKVGGFIAAEDEILRVDPRDYELAVEQAKALVADAQVRVDIEVAEAQVARREWEQLHPGTEPPSPLVLREPQIRQARAALESANAQLAVAKLRLERTSVSLPFDVRVTSENVDTGQYVASGRTVGAAYGVEAVEIEVPLEDEELAWFDIPENDASSGESSSPAGGTLAKVKAEFAGGEHSWDGFVVRISGHVDPMSRMIPVIVEVTDPFGRNSGKPPLLPGIFASVEIQGRVLADALAIPRDAVRGVNQVWVVENDRLNVTPIEIVRTDRDFAYTVSDLGETADIVVSTLDTVVDGMRVRTSSPEQEQAVAASDDANESDDVRAD